MLWLKSYPKNTPQTIEVQHTSIAELFLSACHTNEAKVAFSNFDTEMTYKELLEHAKNLASYLQNVCHLKKGDVVIIQSPNTLQYPIAIYACFLAGLTVSNMNPLYTAREMKEQIQISKAKTLLIFEGSLSHLETFINEFPKLQIVSIKIEDLFPGLKRKFFYFILKYVKKTYTKHNLKNKIKTFNEALKEGNQRSFNQINLSLEDTAFLQFTGGTSGTPKAAVLTHKNILSNFEQCKAWSKETISKNEIVICALPLYHIFSLLFNAILFLNLGSKTILISNPRDIKSFIKTLATHSFSILNGVNTLFKVLMENPKFSKICFKNLKFCIAGGMALEPFVEQTWYQKTGNKIVQGYGLTECSPVVACNPLTAPKESCIGLPLPSTEVKLVNEKGEEAKVGELGELWVKGPQVMKGYFEKKELTESVLQDAWFKTGDIATQDEDGFLKIVDRKKDMIVISGFNVYPTEIEKVLCMHPKILEAGVIGVKDPKSKEAVKAFVVKKQKDLSKEEVLEYAQKHLTKYKVPKQIEFIKSLPKSSTGKILKRLL